MKLPQTFADVKQQVQMQEGTSYPGKALVAMELQPGYDRAKHTMIGHMLAINEALPAYAHQAEDSGSGTGKDHHARAGGN